MSRPFWQDGARASLIEALPLICYPLIDPLVHPSAGPGLEPLRFLWNLAENLSWHRIAEPESSTEGAPILKVKTVIGLQGVIDEQVLAAPLLALTGGSARWRIGVEVEVEFYLLSVAVDVCGK